ncbi:MAG: hypothetical protein LUG93_01005 [Lachnospiraceae bacterium]|nr:hypothetical protein [Lachnospiraceae bacterium]
MAEKRRPEKRRNYLRKMLKNTGEFGMIIIFALCAQEIRKGAGKYHGCIAGWRRE